MREVAFAAAALLLAGSPLPADTQVLTAAGTGITVVGRGAVRVRADELHFVASLFPNTNNRGPGSPLTPPTDLDGAAEAIAKALRTAGVTDAAPGFAGGLNPNGPRTVTGTLRKPTRESVDGLIKAGNLAALPFPNVGLQNVILNFLVDDCGTPEARAQDAALTDSRARAERVARAAGVRLGPVTAVNEATGFYPNATICATRPDTQIAPGGGRLDGDTTTTGDVFVTVSATVTYSIAH